MRIAVTGGAGFIGGHVVRHLSEAGHAVLSLDLQPVDGLDGVAHVAVDVCDAARLAAHLAGFRPDHVFHLAGVADARQALANPVQAVHVNVGGTASVLEAARQTGARRGDPGQYLLGGQRDGPGDPG